MSIEEFLLAFASIVVGLGLSDLLLSFHRLLRATPNVKWDWLTLCFALLMVLISVTLWWFSFYWFDNATSVTMFSFLPKLLFLCIGFLMMAAALPEDVPEGGIDLRAFYMSSRVHRWTLVFALCLLNIIFLVLDDTYASLAEAARWVLPIVVSAALAIACARSVRVWLHAVAIAWITVVTMTNVLFVSIEAT